MLAALLSWCSSWLADLAETTIAVAGVTLCLAGPAARPLLALYLPASLCAGLSRLLQVAGAGADCRDRLAAVRSVLAAP